MAEGPQMHFVDAKAESIASKFKAENMKNIMALGDHGLNEKVWKEMVQHQEEFELRFNQMVKLFKTSMDEKADHTEAIKKFIGGTDMVGTDKRM